MFSSWRDQFRAECKDMTDAFSIKGRKMFAQQFKALENPEATKTEGYILMGNPVMIYS